MAVIGGDGITTVRKLEGFQISLSASQAMTSIRLPIVLHVHTTDRPSHFLAPNIVSIDHVGIRRELESMRWRVERQH
jgi:hypothetical protein